MNDSSRDLCRFTSVAVAVTGCCVRSSAPEKVTAVPADRQSPPLLYCFSDMSTDLSQSVMPTVILILRQQRENERPDIWCRHFYRRRASRKYPALIGATIKGNTASGCYPRSGIIGPERIFCCVISGGYLRFCGIPGCFSGAFLQPRYVQLTGSSDIAWLCDLNALHAPFLPQSTNAR